MNDDDRDPFDFDLGLKGMLIDVALFVVGAIAIVAVATVAVHIFWS
ncbi:MAG: hypothetical protein WC997_16635 [Porticoccaceae bacterium]